MFGVCITKILLLLQNWSFRAGWYAQGRAQKGDSMADSGCGLPQAMKMDSTNAKECVWAPNWSGWASQSAREGPGDRPRSCLLVEDKVPEPVSEIGLTDWERMRKPGRQGARSEFCD